MKKLLTLIFTIFSLSAFSQSWTAAIPHQMVISGAPSASGARLRFDLDKGRIYEWNPTTVSWNVLGQGIDKISGGIPPAYTPDYQQSAFAINDSSELYHYINSAWRCLNCSTGATYTAGTGINIDGSNVISNTGDLSATNELITDFEVTGGSLVVTDAGGGHSVAVTDIAPIQSGLAAEFNQTGSVLSLDYTNAQKATALVPGFLTAADWTTFNNKLSVEVDGSITNEIQTLSFANPNLSISGGNTVDLSGLTPTQLWTDGTQEIYPTDITDNVSIGTTTANSTLDVTVNSLGATPSNTSGIVLSNNTAAAAGAQQISPALRWRGQGWGTTAGTSQSVDWRVYALPIQGNANPDASLLFQSSINGGAYTDGFALRRMVNGTVSAINTTVDVNHGLRIKAPNSGAPWALSLYNSSNSFVGGFEANGRFTFSNSFQNINSSNSGTLALGGRELYFINDQSINSGDAGMRFYQGGNKNITSGALVGYRFGVGHYNPSSGNAKFTHMEVVPVWEQTGTASGDCIGLDYNPTGTPLGNHYAALFRSGFVGIGTSSPTTTLNIKGSGTTSSTTSFLVENNTGTDALSIDDALTIRVNLGGLLRFGAASNSPFVYPGVIGSPDYASGTSLVYDFPTSSFANGVAAITFKGNHVTSTSGTSAGFRSYFRFAPSSGSNRFTNFLIDGEVAQSGTASGVVVGFDYNPTLTGVLGTHYAALFRSGSVGIGTATPSASALVDITSTTSGFLPPRMTTAQRDAIASPATGLIIFCTDCTATDASTGVSQTYSSSAWRNHY